MKHNITIQTPRARGGEEIPAGTFHGGQDWGSSSGSTLRKECLLQPTDQRGTDMKHNITTQTPRARGGEEIPAGTFHGGEEVPAGTFHGGEEIPAGTFHGGEEVPAGTFHGGEEIPAGTFHGGEEIPAGTFHGGGLIQCSKCKRWFSPSSYTWQQHRRSCQG